MSAAALIGIYGYTAYCASKAALAAFAETLRSEARAHGVTISICFPPDTETPQLAREMPLRPPQADIVMGRVRPWTADAVAGHIDRHLEKGREEIFFGTQLYLLGRFGSLSAVLNADHNALAEVEGMGEVSAAALKIVALAARRMARSEVRQKPVLGSWQALLDYLAIDMAHLTVERVRVLYLDTRNRLILDHQAQEGTIDEAAIHPREVVKKALEVGATALILVHNHPSGNPEPSRADIQITARIAEAGRLLGITVHDHVIVGREGHVSLKAKGLI